eukprot:419687-Rhodomonas_salina.2
MNWNLTFPLFSREVFFVRRTHFHLRNLVKLCEQLTHVKYTWRKEVKGGNKTRRRRRGRIGFVLSSRTLCTRTFVREQNYNTVTGSSTSISLVARIPQKWCASGTVTYPGTLAAPSDSETWRFANRDPVPQRRARVHWHTDLELPGLLSLSMMPSSGLSQHISL